MRSMTGYGEGESENERYRARVAIRTVNHRFLDVVLRLPETLRQLEPGLLATVKEGLSRGRVEVRVEVEARVAPRLEVRLNEPALAAYREAVAELEGRPWVAGGTLGVADVLSLPEVLTVATHAQAWEAGDDDVIETAVASALERVMAARRAEGKELARSIARSLEKLEAVVADLEGARAELVDGHLSGLRQRLASLLEGQVPSEERLLQEAAILADRGDVREELDRLRGHLSALAGLVAEGGPVGKRMGFLCQEVLRELNTLGSKCRDAAMLSRVLDGKAACEQLREQIQNVE